MVAKLETQQHQQQHQEQQHQQDTLATNEMNKETTTKQMPKQITNPQTTKPQITTPQMDKLITQLVIDNLRYIHGGVEFMLETDNDYHTYWNDLGKRRRILRTHGRLKRCMRLSSDCYFFRVRVSRLRKMWRGRERRQWAR
ncbi:hypothetical protein Pmani_014960 [Petrolisthes manimaculis]|uniref:Uncharacterized protein n=1 Tax=Petrolisthes manimaculis TaxID=1843537 RepID=A0AAE1UAE0_9EUCA|nr:hypothetical protein Pmani_014960 [Petrolisthes manimaculis]